MADRYEDMQTFVAVVDGQSLQSAADRLGVVKSAVSRRLRDLETRLGARLLDRTTRQLRLTQPGQDFYVRSAKILKDIEDAEASASKASDTASGTLRVTAPVSFTVHCLAPVIPEFQQKHPQLIIEIDANDRMVDIIGEGFDLAIRIGVLKDSRLVSRRIATIRHVACASPRYLATHGRPAAPEELRAHRGTAYTYVDPSHYWSFKNGQSVAAQTALSFNNGDAIREACVAGNGIAVLPTFIVHKSIDRGELEAILTTHTRAPIAMHAIHASNRNVPRKIRLFIDFLAERFGDEPFWDAGRRPHAHGARE